MAVVAPPQPMIPESRHAPRWGSRLAAVLAALLCAAPVHAAVPKRARPRPLSLVDVERALFGALDRQQEARMSDIRRRQIDSVSGCPINREYANKSDILFRLAETTWKEATYQHLLALEAWEAQQQCVQRKAGGCMQSPRPEPDYSAALHYLQRLLRRYPAYRRGDEAMYLVAYITLRGANEGRQRRARQEAAVFLGALLKKYPQSSVAPQAHLLLGGIRFDEGTLAPASQHYRTLVALFPRRSMFSMVYSERRWSLRGVPQPVRDAFLMRDYALYRLAWVYLERKQYVLARDTFQGVLSALPKEADHPVSWFRQRVLADLALARSHTL